MSYPARGPAADAVGIDGKAIALGRRRDAAERLEYRAEAS